MRKGGNALHGGWITNISISKPGSSVSPDLRQKAFPVQFRSEDSIRIWLPSRCDKAGSWPPRVILDAGRQFWEKAADAREVWRLRGCSRPAGGHSTRVFHLASTTGKNENRNVDAFVIAFRVDKRCCRVITRMKAVPVTEGSKCKSIFSRSKAFERQPALIERAVKVFLRFADAAGRFYRRDAAVVARFCQSGESKHTVAIATQSWAL